MKRSRSIPTRLRVSALGLALSLAAGFAGAQVFDQPDTDFKGSVRAASPLVLPGSEIELEGSGFRPGQSVTLLRGETVLNTQPYVADAEGKFAAKLRIPADAAAGLHPVVVRVANPDAAAVFELKVSQEIPMSGQDRFEVASNKLVRGLYQSAYSAASDAIYVTAAVGRPPVTESELLKVDPETLEIVARVTPAKVPGHDDERVFAVYGVGVDDTNGNVWVTNTRDDTAAVYRQSDLSLVKQFEPGAVPHARDVIVDGRHGRAYASAFGENVLAAFDARTLETLTPIAIESTQRGERFSPMSLALDEEGGKLYTVSMSTGEAAVIDTTTGAVERVFRLPNAAGASGVAVDPRGKRLYVASQRSDNLLIADLDSGEVLHDVYVGAGALNVAFDAGSGLAFVPNRVAGTVTAVNADGEIVGNLDGGTFPNHVATDGRGHVYAVNKSRGENDPNGDHIRRITPKAR
ncbi:YncE family protein [Luteimonas sp. Y-2-2-4F]|nr:YncE family protein [Luteimonas sp. Y-2-2-4F]MCD9032321.1 YncE family protein [Luteimonas sp. Y-2-2-4F]